MTAFSEDPGAPYATRLDKASFLAWVQRQERGRFELKNGEILMHAGSTQNHFRVASHFVSALSRRLDLERWMIGGADFAVEIADDIRYPDVLVAPPAREGTAVSTTCLEIYRGIGST